MGIDHVFNRIGNQVTGGQAIEHAVMPHCDAIIHGDGIELLGHAAGRLDFTRHQLAQVLEVHVARHKLGEGVDHGDDGLVEITVFHTGGAP